MAYPVPVVLPEPRAEPSTWKVPVDDPAVFVIVTNADEDGDIVRVLSENVCGQPLGSEELMPKSRDAQPGLSLLVTVRV